MSVVLVDDDDARCNACAIEEVGWQSDDAFDQTQQRRVQWLVEIADVLIRPIDRERILNEVVRSNREEVRLLREDVRDHRRRRNFDHDSDLEVRVVFDTFGVQLFSELADERPHLSQFLHAGDERKHDLQISDDRGAQQRAQLRAEHVAVLHAQAQSTKSEDRIVFARADDFARQLSSTEIECSNDAVAGSETLRQGAVQLQMLFLRRKQRALRNVEKLGAIEADPLRAEPNRIFELFHQLDVRLQRDLVIVLRDRGLRPILEKFSLGFFMAKNATLVFGDHRLGRIDDQRSFIAIDDDHFVVVDDFGQP